MDTCRAIKHTAAGDCNAGLWHFLFILIIYVVVNSLHCLEQVPGLFFVIMLDSLL